MPTIDTLAASCTITLVGAGPAAISAALWLHDSRATFLWVSADHGVGGTLNRVNCPINTYPGIPVKNASELVSRFGLHLATHGLYVHTDCELTSLIRREDRFELGLRNSKDDTTVKCPIVMLCTGTRPRRLNLAPSGVLQKPPAKPVVGAAAVVGGGDSAKEKAIELSKIYDNVHLLHRGESLRGYTRFTYEVFSTPNITVHLNATVARVISDVDGDLTGVVTGEGTEIPVDALFVRIGVDPHLPPGIPPELTDGEGYLRVDADGRTQWPGLYAAGDVTGYGHQSIAWSVGLGCRAADTILNDTGCKHLMTRPTTLRVN